VVHVDGLGAVEEGVEQAQPEDLLLGAGDHRRQKPGGLVISHEVVQLGPANLRRRCPHHQADGPRPCDRGSDDVGVDDE